MTLILKELVTAYQTYFGEMGDPRTKDWPLMGSPLPIVFIVAAYLWFVKKGGPALMKNRKALELDRVIQAYNILQVVVCGWLGIYGGLLMYSPWGGIYSFWCEPLDLNSTDDDAFFILKMFYTYFLTKILDLMDTVFFVLRKKDSQITFLHVYHHTLMALIIWYAMRYLPGGHGVFVGLINSFVHSIMYFYYFLTNWNKEYRKNVWWKKHITQLQLFQFFVIFFHFSQFLLFQTCDFPRVPLFFLLPQVMFIIILFSDFYWKTYVSPKKTTSVNKTE